MLWPQIARASFHNTHIPFFYKIINFSSNGRSVITGVVD
jgi:hypothetical protein